LLKWYSVILLVGQERYIAKISSQSTRFHKAWKTNMDKKIAAGSNNLDKLIPVNHIPLKRVLDQSEEIQESVKDAADQLSFVNLRLKQEDKDNLPVQSIQEVVTQNEEIEQKLVKAADDLHQVNAELAQAVAERIEIESELVDKTNDLSEVYAALSKAQSQEEDAIHIGLHDALTELPNRLLFEQRLDYGLIQAKRHGWKLAILFIDLDKFKDINDTYGHQIGDKVLILTADRLKVFVRGEDTVSRWGGDEFVCILMNFNLEADVVSLAEKIVDHIAEECEFDGIILSIRATIGIAIYPQDGETANILFKNVDRAMYKLKGTDQRVTLFN
jgi:diguanylate cyclase (GGDEF)-like protein